MEFQTIFWALIVCAILQAVAIYMVGQSIKTIINTKSFRKGILNRDEKKDGTKIIGFLMLVLAGGTGNITFAQELEAAAEGVVEVVAGHPFYNRVAINILLVINLFMTGVLLYMRGLFKNFYKISASKELLASQKRVKRVRVNKILTDAVPLTEEESILLNHDYDGIMELDNNLPPWWKWGFYISIVAGIIYLMNFHVLKISPLQAEEYEISMQEAEIEVAEYLKAQALNVDEYSVVPLTDIGDINSGKELFNQYCVACHLETGAGVVGPNLTDDYWIHGDQINDIFKTIKYGAENGMKSWKDELNPVQMQQVSSYILTLRGTNPPNPKEPQGDYYPPAGGADSVKVELAIDSLTNNAMIDSLENE